jgi:4-alpha-glucanotransferase
VKTVNLIFGVHNHQPVGNFDHIFEEAYQKAYLPFLTVLLRHPQIKMSFHYTGALFQFIKLKHPEFMEKLVQMVKQKQIEIMTGGFYEPILAILPDDDKKAQIEKLTAFIRDTTGYQARGMWLAERIWEPHLVKPLQEAKVEYVVVDDYHFKSAGLSEDDLYGYYISEEQGKSLAMFPISQKLRYLIPFAMPEKTIEYCAQVASDEGNRLLVIADDGEKFGVWPQTYHSVYEEKWLERFFEKLEENSSWLKTTTFTEYLDTYKPKGRAYVPCASYSEMLEWSLPEHAQEIYEHIVDQIKQNQDQQGYLQFIKGGFWRNFLVKYPESNMMHKKMLEVSGRVNTAIKAGIDHPQLWQAQDELLAAQVNDGYWHGVFGGLYMSHLRRSIYENLIKAENNLDAAVVPPGEITCQTYDYNNDDSAEIIAANKTIKIYVAPEVGGKILELDYRPKNFNCLNVLSRHKEAYHQKIKDFVEKHNKEQESNEAKTIHEQFRVKEKNLDQYLKYDWYERGFAIDHFLSEWGDLAAFHNCNFGEQGDFVNQTYDAKCQQDEEKLQIALSREGHVWIDKVFATVKVEKKITILRNQSLITIGYVLSNLENSKLDLCFGSEYCFAGTTGHDDGCFYYSLGGKDKIDNKYMDSVEENIAFQGIGIKDYFTRIDACWQFSEAPTVWRFPLETVSQSESGFERSYQGSVIMPFWKVALKPKGQWQTAIKFTLKDLTD